MTIVETPRGLGSENKSGGPNSSHRQTTDNATEDCLKCETNMTNRFKLNRDAWWLHWFDGLPDVLGAISMLAYGLSVTFFFVTAQGAFDSSSDDKLGQGFLVNMTIAGMAVAGMCVLISICGCLLCFRANKRFVQIFLLFQVPILLLTLIYCVLIFSYVL